MASREHKLRAPDRIWEVIATEAAAHGQSTSSYVLEAAFARAIVDRVRRGAGGPDEYGELAAQARRYLEAMQAADS
jgi:hypothetical protein